MYGSRILVIVIVILHPLGHFLLRFGADFTTHGLLFKGATYQLLECSSHGSNPQALLLSYQLILVALHGSSFHPAAVYVPDSIEHIILLPKRKIPPEIIISLDGEVHFPSPTIPVHRRTE